MEMTGGWGGGVEIGWKGKLSEGQKVIGERLGVNGEVNALFLSRK